jgi:hypothetical protein
VTLFHAVAGQAPFPEESGIVALSRHLFDEVPDLRTVRPATSPALAKLIYALTRRQPEHRPKSAAEVVRALESVAAGWPAWRAA